MNIYKFGGASIENTERIKSTANIIATNSEAHKLVVISAMGKTTNALEKVVEAFYSDKQTEALMLFEIIKTNHINVLKQTCTLQYLEGEKHLKEIFTEVEWILHDKPVRSFDYYYDQIVCCGELLSTIIVYHYLLENNVKAFWVDVRDIVRTDNNFRDAIIDWPTTIKNVNDIICPLFLENDIVLTQGFVGSTDENESTTLGREGSDFSAAIFANILNAEALTIWKDVEAVMSADPKRFKHATNIASLSYKEVIEMAYYGANVIHPKTIKPLQNKKIPLHVKCFLNPDLPGTTINNKMTNQLPPIIVYKENQAVVNFYTKDFSFIEDTPINELQEIFKSLKIKPNLTQNSAISMQCCFDDRTDKIDALAMKSADIFDVSVERNLSMLTIRHYNNEIVDELTTGKSYLFMQKTNDTLQVVLK